jgi:hypothetical protein
LSTSHTGPKHQGGDLQSNAHHLIFSRGWAVTHSDRRSSSMDNVTRELFSSSGDRLIPGLSIADIAEAALRPNLRVVREKTRDELDLQAYHRIRSRLVSRRTATVNSGVPDRTGDRHSPRVTGPAHLAFRHPEEPGR